MVRNDTTNGQSFAPIRVEGGAAVDFARLDYPDLCGNRGQSADVPGDPFRKLIADMDSRKVGRCRISGRRSEMAQQMGELSRD